MTGKYIVRNNDDDGLILIGGSDWTKGAHLSLFGASYSNMSGMFELAAVVEGVGAGLRGTYDGSLTWGDKNIDVIDSKGDGYIRYSSGFQICWGDASTTTGSSIVSRVFAKPFAGNCIIVGSILGLHSDGAFTIRFEYTNVSSFTAKTSNNAAGSPGISAQYIAFGWWK